MKILVDMPRNLTCSLLLALPLAMLTGCEQAMERAREAREINRQAAARPTPAAPRPRKTPTRQPLDDDVPLPEIAASGLLYEPSPAADAERLGGVTEEVAIERVIVQVRDAAALDPALVVWLLDRSPSAGKIVYQANRRIQQFYTDIAKGRVSEVRPREAPPRLLTAVVSFGRDVQFPLEQPSDDAPSVMAALDAIPVEADPRESTFAAVAAALEKYLPQRLEHGRRLLLVVVTDEAGDDGDRVEEVLAAPRKYGVPIYVIGAPAPFGQVSALPNGKEGEMAPDAPGKPAGAALRHGPESRRLERVNLPSLAGFWRNEVLEAGFGPFALERLCRATGGEFILLQPPARTDSSEPPIDWPSSRAVRFEKDVMSRYAPDYVSAEAYQSLLSENGARMALHRAAQMERLPGPFYPETEFPRDTQSAMQRRLDRAQQLAARLAPEVDRVYEMLLQGEADRATLIGPRWQAGFDLALGRAAAAKARIDGYNAALAMLKRGRRFENPKSTRWLLVPTDATDAGSAVERLIEKGRMCLERVVAEHPGTPWEHIARQELEAKFGWRWVEQ